MFSRRSIIAGISGLGATLALPTGAMARSAPKMARLRPGDTVGLIAPASVSDDPFSLETAQSTMRGMGLVPKLGQHAADRFGYLAGTDRDRAADVHAMFADESVRAIFALRGGWGGARMLPLLDWDLIRAHPKLLVGFSDVTAFHLAFAARAGFPTIHGPNAGNRWDSISWNSFWRIAFAGQTPILNGSEGQDVTQDRWRITTIRPGKASGRLLGGNLTVLSTMMGSPWLPDFDGAILFLEEVGEAEYRVDRMLNQLALAGILRKVAGVVFGQCSRCDSGVANYTGFSVPQILHQYLSQLGIPVFAGANIGHVGNQLSLPVGADVRIDAEAGTIELLDPIVA
ncbi:muramoyltetrapeptide carboxypeptidase [Sphingomonas laterariae]|uniref:Muramoyltetrapeptide carboxypeptidase n=1 Tax=Edaphosphingomonas laterariae TaxID=861865 RepID=A0A239D7F7_9SPHN|nr:LD-carboxypeptidase [Sphingomonas laterariae]SNS27791.1 muramoyltetrapeptide carboxypeptidase [Sphingomonas laterariae]